jgi:hypothetical protein
VQYKQQANPLLSMYNYTPLVISENDKKSKQIPLLSQHKLALTGRNGSGNSEGHKKKLIPGATLIQVYIYPFMSSKAQYSS